MSACLYANVTVELDAMRLLRLGSMCLDPLRRSPCYLDAAVTGSPQQPASRPFPGELREA